MKKKIALYTNRSVEYETPRELFDELDKEFNFDLDPCATKENAKCRNYFTEKEDGLLMSWQKYPSVFMNPPYGREVGKWVAKAHEETMRSYNGLSYRIKVVCLLPARTDTKWFHKYIWYKTISTEIRFIKGRLKFSRAKNSAPFPSMIVIFGRKK